MSELWSDLRQAGRRLRHAPGFTLVVSVILALTLGTATAVFSVLDRTLLRPLPSRDAARWVHLGVDRGNGRIAQDFSYPLYTDVRDRAGVFDAVIAHASMNLSLERERGADRLNVAGVSAGFLRALGIGPVLGRDITAEEDRPGDPTRVVVLSHGLWETRFGGDTGVLGRAIRLDGEPYVVIGVTPAGFLGLVRGTREDAWVPITAHNTAGDRAYERRTVSWIDLLGRLAPGMDRARATHGLDLLARRLVSDSLLPADNRFALQDGSAGLTQMVANLGRPLRLLLVASGLVLLVACANLASLFLARTSARRRELAIRLSLGASRLSVARLLLAEAVVLALLGGLGSCLVAVWLGGATPTLHTLLGGRLELAGGFDLRLVGFAAGGAILAALAVAAGPVAWALRFGGVRGLRTEASEEAGSGSRGGLVVAQLAFTVLLVTGAVLLATTARRLAAVDPGYQAAGVLMAGVDLQAGQYDGARAAAFWDELTARLDREPGVALATVTGNVTPSPGGMHWDQVALEGSPEPADKVGFDMNLAGPDYFHALRIPILAGRGFTRNDRLPATGRGSGPRVAVVNQAMARRYWGGESPIGRHIYLRGDSTSPGTEIVGVVADGKYRSLREAPLPVVYLPALESPPATGWLLVRARPGLAADGLAATVRNTVRALDPGLPVFGIAPLTDHLGLASATERLLAFLGLVYGGLATLLAAVGLFGLVSYSVSRRRHEIGIRVALGAAPATIRRRFVGQGLRRAGLGVGLGLLLVAATGRLVESLLFGVAPLDPAVLGGVTLLMLAVAALASWWPAARAARVDPMRVLRSD